ncbi:MAG TPA: hypothetical protein VES68_00490 [Candidatus Sulfotelmatobacter sp.]|nr:hypothetical protein [Candidatus Sulfotelmatobacter sp.]
MKKISQILKNFDPTKDKYISRDFQSFGIWLAEEMDDYKNRGMWIRLAKTNHRSILEKALSFTKDANADNKIALFLWKMKQLKNETSKTQKK